MVSAQDALTLRNVGLSVIPCKLSNKRPALSEWGPFQKALPSEEQIKSWFPAEAVAAITGEVSGLELIDFDFKGEFYDAFAKRLEEQAPGTLEKLVVAKTQNGGRHLIYRFKWAHEWKRDGNRKLAFKRVEVPGPGLHKYGNKELPAIEFNSKWYIQPGLIETRGEGGYFLIPPSTGYEVVQGSLDKIPDISQTERDLIIQTAEYLDESIIFPMIPMPERETKPRQPGDPLRPGDDYNQRADALAFLLSKGWSFHSEGKKGKLLTRPGKSPAMGASANLFDNGYLLVWSTSAIPSADPRAYSPFSIYIHLQHNGNVEAAVKDLAAKGYGDQTVPCQAKPPEIPQRTAYESPTPKDVAAAVKGSPLQPYISEASQMSREISWQFYLLDSIIAAGACLSNRYIKLGASEDDYDFLWPNVFGIKVASGSKGKSRTSGLLMKGILPNLGVEQIEGKSEAALVHTMSEHGRGMGIVYEKEIKKLLDKSDVTSAALLNFLMVSWDSGRFNYTVCPRGQIKTVNIDPAYPSCLIEGQPGIIEKCFNQAALDAAFPARFLIAYPMYPTTKIVKANGVAKASKIIEAYKAAYCQHSHQVVTYDLAYEPKSRMNDWFPNMNEAEQASQGRLSNMYCPKIALMLNPDALKTGRVKNDDLDRAMVICDFFFANSIRFYGLMNEDLDEMRRVKAAQYIMDHATRFDDQPSYGVPSWIVYSKALKVGWPTFARDIAVSLQKRGEVVFVPASKDARDWEGKWYRA